MGAEVHWRRARPGCVVLFAACWSGFSISLVLGCVEAQQTCCVVGVSAGRCHRDHCVAQCIHWHYSSDGSDGLSANVNIGLTSRCSRRLAGLFPPALMIKILPDKATRALARRG